jgi:uncharacterized membrane protein
MNATNANDVIIGSKFENYYNNLLQLPPQPVSTQDTPTGWVSWFYEKFIENNILILCLLLCIGIYLYLRYQYNQEKLEEERQEKIRQAKILKKRTPKRDVKQEHLNAQINKMKEYDENLKKEKEKLLRIIDEISAINDERELEKLYNSVNGSSYNREPPIQNLESEYLHNGVSGSANGSYQLLKEHVNVDNYIGGFYVDAPYR